MTTQRKRRDPCTRSVVRLPERDLSESISHLAEPLLEPLGPRPAPDEIRRAIGLAVNLWNAQVTASQLWGDPRPKPLADLRKAMRGNQVAATFEQLSARWRNEFAFDPRLVREWSFDATDDGRHQLVCEMALPAGIEAHVPPPAEKRIAIGGKFLDEVSIRLSATTYLSFPIESHRGNVGTDGVVTIHAKMPTVVQLFAEGRLTRVGGAPVDVMVGGKELGSMVLSDVGCAGQLGYNDIAVLVFRRATPVMAEIVVSVDTAGRRIQ